MMFVAHRLQVPGPAAWWGAVVGSRRGHVGGRTVRERLRFPIQTHNSGSGGAVSRGCTSRRHNSRNQHAGSGVQQPRHRPSLNLECNMITDGRAAREYIQSTNKCCVFGKRRETQPTPRCLPARGSRSHAAARPL